MKAEKPLDEISFADLKSIAKKTGLEAIPRTYKKEDLKKYIIENSNEKQREAWIKELKHSAPDQKGKENEKNKKPVQKESFSRKEHIVDLQKEKIHRIAVEAACELFNEPMPKGTGVGFYDGMSDKLLKQLFEIFVKKLDDPDGKYFELRSANWLVYRIKEIGAMRTRHTLPGSQELRMIGFDVEGLPYLIGEFSDKGEAESDFKRAIENARRVLDNYGQKLIKKYKKAWMRVYFFVPGEQSENLLKIIKEDKTIDNEGIQRVKRGFLKTDHFIKISAFRVNGNKYEEIHL